MLTQEQVREIKNYLERVGNPLFFFDNDVDGLCSFLLLARYIGRGKGVSIKSFPDLNVSYSRKLYELNPDSVFVLDKPIISEGFLKEIDKLNLPLIWIDHHDVENKVVREVGGKLESSDFIPSTLKYYNPNKEFNRNHPVTYLSWQINQKKEDIWLALAGCIGDNYLPDFLEDFKALYPDLIKGKTKSAFEILYETEIGKITRIMNFALKDRTSNVVRMIKYLLQIKDPREILNESPKNHMLFRYNQVNRKYQKLIERARNFDKEKVLYFQYGGDLSLSGDIANELSYRYPHKIIIVAYIKGTKANISLRGENIREIAEKIIKNFEDATAGGHKNAAGGKLNVEDLPKFKERIEKLVS